MMCLAVGAQFRGEPPHIKNNQLGDLCDPKFQQTYTTLGCMVEQRGGGP